MDSTALEELVSAHTAAASRGARLVVCGLPATARDALRDMPAARVLEIHEDEDAALAAVS